MNLATAVPAPGARARPDACWRRILVGLRADHAYRPVHSRQLRQLAGSHHEQDRTELCRRLLLLCADGRLLAVDAPAAPSAIPS